MENLTLEQLAPYLPYGLKFTGSSDLGQTLIGIDIRLNQIKCIIGYGNDAETVSLKSNKPILRPLSDLTDINSKAMSELNCDIVDQVEIIDLATNQQSLAGTSYGAVDVLIRNHVDIFALIEKGLAIDINTL